MATKEQYEFFKSVYDEHRDRIKALESRAQLYFTIQSLYFGFVVLKLSDIYGAHDGAKLPGFFAIFQVVVALFLAFALTCTLFAVRIQRYETASDLRDTLKEIVQGSTNEQFYGRRIVDYMVAAETISDVNLRGAKSLRIACWLTILAVATHLVFVMCSASIWEAQNAPFLGNVILNICLAAAVAFLIASENRK
jgi:hypothetical protein